MILGVLGCKSAWPNGLPRGFLPDMGLALLKCGLAHDSEGKKYFHMFSPLLVTMATKVEDGLYSINGIYVPEGTAHFIVTFDFGSDEYQEFLAALPPELRERVKSALSHQPYRILLEISDAP